jgi:hypothetical protein
VVLDWRQRVLLARSLVDDRESGVRDGELYRREKGE